MGTPATNECNDRVLWCTHPEQIVLVSLVNCPDSHALGYSSAVRGADVKVALWRCLARSETV